MQPWRVEFVQKVQTFRISRDRFLALGDVLRVLEAIMDTWDETGQLDVRYWAGADDDSLFGRFYRIVSDPLATRFEILQVAHELVRYLKSLLFMQTAVFHITNDSLVTFMNLRPSEYAFDTLGSTAHPNWDTSSPMAAPTRSPVDPFEKEPKELYVSPLWPCLKLTVRHIRQLGIDRDDLRTTFQRLDRDVDLCLVASGLAARFQWFLSMAIVSKDHGEQFVVSYLQSEAQPAFRDVFSRATAAVRVNLSPRYYWPGTTNPLELRLGLHNFEHANGPQTLDALKLYCAQLLKLVQEMRDQGLWPERRSFLSAVFRERMRQLREEYTDE